MSVCLRCLPGGMLIIPSDTDGGYDFTDNPLAAYVDFSMFSDSTLPLVADSAWW